MVPTNGTYTSLGPDGQPVAQIGGNQGEIRYQVAAPVKVRVSQYRDPNTGAFTGSIKPYEGQDDVVGKQLDIVGPGGEMMTVYGTYVGGRLQWTTEDPFAEVGGTRGTITTDKDGTIVRNYSAYQDPLLGPKVKGAKAGPTPGFVPSAYLDMSVFSSPDTKQGAWNPKTDKRTAWDSPLSAITNMSTEHAKWVSSLGDTAITGAEREWYSNTANWTPDMRKLADQGIDPTIIVNRKSGELTAQIRFNRQYGYTPEQINRTVAAEKAWNEKQAAQQEGMTVGQYREHKQMLKDTSTRNILIDNLSDWGLDHQQAVYGAGRPAGMAGPDTRSKTMQSPLPQGWSAGDLLAQPGMSLDMANDLAYRVSNGAVGKQFGFAPGVHETPAVGNMGGGRQYTTPGTNPFMPKPGSKGASYALGPAGASGIGRPPPARPKPHTVVKPKAKVEPREAIALSGPKTGRPAPVKINKPPAAKGYTVVKDSHGNWAYRPVGGGRAIIA